MPPSDKKKNDCDTEESARLTSEDLNKILETNKKAIEIYLEVEGQFEKISENLTTVSTELKEYKKKIDDIDKALFKLIIILGSIGVGTIVNIIQIFTGHK